MRHEAEEIGLAFSTILLPEQKISDRYLCGIEIQRLGDQNVPKIHCSLI